MTYTVYVLYSYSADKLYTGVSSDFITRFHFHNFKSTKGFTKRYRPWYCILVEFYDDLSVALKREKELKSGKGREYIRKQILPNYH